MALLQSGQVFKILAPQKVIPKPRCTAEDYKNRMVDSYRSGDDALEVAEALWVVTGTEMSGGGTAHGPHDVYPDGHGVKAVRINADGEATGETIFFRQSGCFNNMLEEEEIQVVGTVTGRRYTLTLME